MSKAKVNDEDLLEILSHAIDGACEQYVERVEMLQDRIDHLECQVAAWRAQWIADNPPPASKLHVPHDFIAGYVAGTQRAPTTYKYYL